MDYDILLNNHFNNEDTGLWFVNTPSGPKVVLKLPTHSIKSIYKGCRVELIFKTYEYQGNFFLLSAVTIHDVGSNPLAVFGINRFEKEIEAIKEVFSNDRVYVEFYSELIIAVLSATLEIDNEIRSEVLTLISPTDNFYQGAYDKYDSNIDIILDKYQDSVSKDSVEPDIAIDCKFYDLKIIKNTIVGVNEINDLLLNETEGVGFEKQIWAVFESIFDSNLFKNPYTLDKKQRKELIDLFSFYEYGFFLIEVKALGVISVEKNDSMERKVLNVQSQIKKGIKQILGARKNVSRNCNVYNQEGKELTWDRTLFPHGLIIVSEILPFGDWREVEILIVKAMLDGEMCLNVIDLVELMKLIKMSEGRREMFDYLLLQRRDEFIKKNANIHIKGKVIDNYSK